VGEVAEIKRRLSDLADDTLEGTADTRVAAVVSQVSNVLLRAVTVELGVREKQKSTRSVSRCSSRR
jgi:hypothetical protein